MNDNPVSRFYLVTPRIADSDGETFGALLSEVLSAVDVACVLARLAPQSETAAVANIARLTAIAAEVDAALLVEGNPRLALRAGAHGVHIHGAGAELSEAIASLSPEGIVGAGLLRSRDEAMRAGEAGADYVMFGEPLPDGHVPPAAETIKRTRWWAEIFEPPCVGFAYGLADIAPLAAAGADFIALGDAVWLSNRPAEALALAEAALLAPQAG